MVNVTPPRSDGDGRPLRSRIDDHPLLAVATLNALVVLFALPQILALPVLVEAAVRSLVTVLNVYVGVLQIADE